MTEAQKDFLAVRLNRSINEPIRDFQNMSWDDLWRGEDQGLIHCWERGRMKRTESPALAARAEQGELMILNWRGGVEKKMQAEKKLGTLQYLANWQGLRGEDLDITLEDETLLTCAKTGQTVTFSAKSEG